jgi:O-antigen/teichoic acid export membrane protein
LFGATRVDQAVIGPVLGSTKLGIYAVAVAVSLLPFAFGPALASRAFSEVAAARDDRERFTLISHWLRMTLLVGGAATAAVALAGPILVPVVYGNAFRAARAPLFLLLPGTVALILNATASVSLVALGKPGQATWSEFSGFAVTAVGLVVVVRPFGIVGAAVLSTVTYATSFTAFQTFLRRAGPVSILPRKAELVDAMAMARAAGRKAISAITPGGKPEPAGDRIGSSEDVEGPTL